MLLSPEHNDCLGLFLSEYSKANSTSKVLDSHTRDSIRPMKTKQQTLCIALALGTALSAMPLFPTPAAAGQTLQGRIEQINASSDVKLPIELHASTLKLRDLTPVTHTLQAGLKSFPGTLRGTWKGPLEITDCDYSDAFASAQPADAERAKQLIHDGLTAESYFRFYTPKPGLVTMAPPEIKVTQVDPTTKTINNIYLSAPDLDSARYSSMGDNNSVKHTLIKNDVRVLAKDVVEQDLVVAIFLTDRKTGKQTKTYEETVYQFTKDKPFQLSVEVAKIKYGENGQWWSKALLKGIVR